MITICSSVVNLSREAKCKKGWNLSYAIIIINSIHLVNLLITFIFSLSDEVDKQDLLKEHADNNKDDSYRVRKV